MPCAVMAAVSMAARQKSPIFCALLPTGARASAAAVTLRDINRCQVSSWTTAKIPHMRSLAGIGLSLIHVPTAYWKKSSRGETDGSTNRER